jgi:hypothetical protein
MNWMFKSLFMWLCCFVVNESMEKSSNILLKCHVDMKAEEISRKQISWKKFGGGGGGLWLQQIIKLNIF